MNTTETSPSLPSQPKGLFSRPRLPESLLLLVLGTIATHAALLLATQPAAYWIAPRLALRASIPHWLAAGLLANGPWLFAAAALAYLLAAGLLLSRLNRSAALALGGALFFFHLYNLQALSGSASVVFQWGILAAIVMVLLLVWTGARPLRLSRAARFLAKLPFLAALRLPDRRPVTRALAGAWLVFLAAMVAQSAVIPRTGWQPLAPRQMPSARYGMAVTYDTRRSRAVMFGGVTFNERNQFVFSAETWEWDGKDWTSVHTDDAPSGRWFPSMAYDESRGVVVLYGGMGQNGTLMDLWEYDGHNWKWLCPSCNPAARWGATMIYDPGRKRVVMYGGVGPDDKGENKWYSEAWAWDGKKWEFQQIDTPSPNTFNPALAYDPDRQRILAFVDQEGGGTSFWKGSTWTHLGLKTEPPRSKSAQVVYDPFYQRFLLYGGIQENASSPYVKTNKLLKETWVYEQDAWRRLDTPLSPPARQDHIAFYDPTRRSLILFGGRTENSTPFGDMWELPLSGQTPGLPAQEAK